MLYLHAGAFIDQSQSLNLFIENPNIGQLSSMNLYAWKRGLETTYYLRSRPATRIAKTLASREPTPAAKPEPKKIAEPGWTPAPPGVASAASSPSVSDSAAVSCSLENPESCESCQ